MFDEGGREIALGPYIAWRRAASSELRPAIERPAI